MTTMRTTVDTPAGTLLLTGEPDGADGVRLASIRFSDVPGATTLRPAAAPFADAIRQITEYFAGRRTTFDVGVATAGTDFQRRVWHAIDKIGYGETISYAKLAARAGVPVDRVRAVAAAVGANPLLIVRPCHRVVGADGSLTGYAGGLDRKRFLLTLEGAWQPALM